MRKYVVTILMSLLTINFTFAAENQNKKVPVSRTDGVWEYSVQGSIGRELVKLIPVTREAASELNKLTKDSNRLCDIQAGTLVTNGKESSGGNYFVLDIKCD